ncbi:MAG: hypothetical protein SFX73_09085 [Kofleriaceae bacterium]|nr:hypothetical protein [Kofleriaceae bacterium]
MKLSAAFAFTLAACGSSPESQPDAALNAEDARRDGSVDGLDAPVDAPGPRQPAACPQPPCTLRVSVASDGTQGNGISGDLPTISGDGLMVAFVATSSNLVMDDTNGEQDVFVRDLATDTTTRVSVGSAGQANAGSGAGWITDDGRQVAFASAASNLLAGDTNDASDVFVIDLATMAIERASLTADDAQTGTGGGNGSSNLSADGRYVLFNSHATNVVPGDTNGNLDLFVRDRVAGTTVRVDGGTLPNGVTIAGQPSLDGAVVGFYSTASNVIANDANGNKYDVFLRTTATGAITLISQSTAGVQANESSWVPYLSADKRLVAFQSYATNLVANDTNGMNDIFLRDLDASTTTLISRGMGGVPANGPSENPKLSADGRYILFVSAASNLVPDDTNNARDAFLFDRMTDMTMRVSVGDQGQQGNAHTYYASLSSSGNAVVFSSRASNLVTNDTNGESDTFVRYLSSANVIE